ncbi:MAG TPA: TetR/AcrR family transcriptional regulator [Sphingomonas sp.]|nr:TetR/AcrR family transcriptional regulator [Sphingomonas sp.]
MSLDNTLSKPGKAALSRDAASVRGRILDAALQEFMAVGYAKTNTARIASAFGISTATIFRHFGTKQQLFEAVIRRIAARWHDHIDWEHIDAADPETWLTRFGEAALHWIMTDETLFVGRMAIVEGPAHSEITDIWPKYAAAPIIEILSAKFSGWQRAGLLMDMPPELLATAFLDLTLSGEVSRALYSPQQLKPHRDQPAHVRNCVTIFLRGCMIR